MTKATFRKTIERAARHLLAALALLASICLTAPLPAYAQSVGGACSVTSGSIAFTNGLLLICNGSTWTLAESFTSGGNVGIGTNTINSMLDVAGDIRSETGTAAAGGSCSPNGATVAAAYSASGENLICTSGVWAVVSSAGSSCTWHSTAFTTVGANTWTYPSGTVQAVWAFLVGGGGGGGISALSFVVNYYDDPYWSGGGGGGGGGISWSQIPATGNLTVTVGAGGAGGTGGGGFGSGSGANGGNTTVAQGSTILLSAGGGQGAPFMETENGQVGGSGGVGNFGNAGTGSFYAGANGNGAAGGGVNAENDADNNAYVDGYSGGNSSFALGGSAGGAGVYGYSGGGGGASWGAGAAGSSNSIGNSASANTGGGGGGAPSANINDPPSSSLNGGGGGSGYAVIWACY